LLSSIAAASCRAFGFVVNSFDRTLRSLGHDGVSSWGRGALLVTAFATLLAWSAWLARAEIDIYVVSTTARLEVTEAAHPIDAPVAGVVRTLRAGLGEEVHAGDVLLELDAEELEVKLADTEQRSEALRALVDATAAEVDAEASVAASEVGAARAQVDVADARRKQAEAAAGARARQADRMRRLADASLASAMDLDDARAAAEAHSLAAEILDRDRAREAMTLGTRREQHALKRAEGGRRLAELRARRAELAALQAELRLEIRRRRVVAPVDGVVADVVAARPGTVVQAGQRFAVVVPRGAVRLVARFATADAVGRVRPGQRGRMRMDGFSWTQFGVVTGTVTSVGSEANADGVRVELVPDSTATLPPGLPLEHGMPGQVEIGVEHGSPLALLLRGIGARLRGARA
jgi:multidrug resistance efflux pump